MCWANAIMICAAVITPSLVLFVLAFLINLLFSFDAFMFLQKSLCRLCDVYDA